MPTSNQNANLIYESSNSSVLFVDNKGLVTAKSQEEAIITIRDSFNTIRKNISFTVMPKAGTIIGNQYIWAFHKQEDIVPTRADLSFFINLAQLLH